MMSVPIRLPLALAMVFEGSEETRPIDNRNGGTESRADDLLRRPGQNRLNLGLGIAYRACSHFSPDV